MPLRLFEWGCPNPDLCVVQWGRYVGFAFRRQGQHHAEVRHGDRVVGRTSWLNGGMPVAKREAEELLLEHMSPEQRSLVYRARAAGLSGTQAMVYCGRAGKRASRPGRARRR